MPQLNYRQIAKYYGEGPLPPPSPSHPTASNRSPTGTTYNSIEGRFRIIKEQAKVLKAESDGKRATTTSTNSTSTPKKDKVLSGRVQKNGTPSKPSKTSSNTRDADEALALFGTDGTAEIPDGGNRIIGVKEEVVSSGTSSYYSGEEAVSGAASMGMDLAWDDGFLGQQLI